MTIENIKIIFRKDTRVRKVKKKRRKKRRNVKLTIKLYLKPKVKFFLKKNNFPILTVRVHPVGKIKSNKKSIDFFFISIQKLLIIFSFLIYLDLVLRFSLHTHKKKEQNSF